MLKKPHEFRCRVFLNVRNPCLHRGHGFFVTDRRIADLPFDRFHGRVVATGRCRNGDFMRLYLLPTAMQCENPPGMIASRLVEVACTETPALRFPMIASGSTVQRWYGQSAVLGLSEMLELSQEDG